jgi:glycosyltransferase involved in cell wall biosynthesis
MRDLILNFGINCFTGWGLVGMNYCGLLSRHYNVIAPNAFGASELIGMDPLKWPVMERIAQASKAWVYNPDCVWMDPIGNDLKTPHEEIDAKVQIARVIVEKPDVSRALEYLSHYDKILTGSTWNKEIIEAATGKDVKVIYEGIDPGLFHPGDKSGWLPRDPFYIYSAGKVEFRKAQDVVLMAFARFVKKHPSARLVTCWNSPFGDIGNGYRGNAAAPLWLKENGQLDVKRWANDNDIDPAKIIDLGGLPNFTLPQVLREMDVMLAPTRVESCTSLPVKEAMACGVPVIYGYHTGMKDLEGHGMPLYKQTPIRASSEYFFPSNNIDWYESDPDEIDEALEDAYEDRDGLTGERRRDVGAAHFIRSQRTWERHTAELKEWIDA